MDSASAVERAAAASILGTVGSREAVEPIAALLPDEDREVANAATMALFELGEAAIDALLAALAHPRSGVRSRAAVALGKIGDLRAVPALEAALDDPEPDVRWRALRSIVALAASDLRERLSQLVDDPDVVVRLTARDTLEMDDGGPVEDDLAAGLHRYDRGMQVAAAHALAARRSIEPLIDALGDRERDVRDAAQTALLAVDDEGIAPLMRLFNDSRSKVRLQVARLLARREDIDAIDYLIGTLDAGSLAVGDETAETLLDMRGYAGPMLLQKVHDARNRPCRRGTDPSNGLDCSRSACRIARRR